MAYDMAVAGKVDVACEVLVSEKQRVAEYRVIDVLPSFPSKARKLILWEVKLILG